MQGRGAAHCHQGRRGRREEVGGACGPPSGRGQEQVGPRSSSLETSTSPAATTQGWRGQQDCACSGALWCDPQRPAPKSDGGGGTPQAQAGAPEWGRLCLRGGAGRLLTCLVSCGCMTKHHSLCGLTQRKWAPSVPRQSLQPPAPGLCRPWRWLAASVVPGLWLHRSHPLGATAQPPMLPGASVQPRTSVQDTSRVVPPQATSRSQGPESVSWGRCGEGALAEGTVWARPGDRPGV